VPALSLTFQLTNVIDQYTADPDAFIATLKADIAKALGVPLSQVSVSELSTSNPDTGAATVSRVSVSYAGVDDSAIVNVKITVTAPADNAETADTRSLDDLKTELTNQAADPASPLRTGELTNNMNPTVGFAVVAPPSSGGGLPIPIIAGAAGAVIVLIGGFYIYRTRCRGGKKNSVNDTDRVDPIELGETQLVNIVPEPEVVHEPIDIAPTVEPVAESGAEGGAEAAAEGGEQPDHDIIL